VEHALEPWNIRFLDAFVLVCARFAASLVEQLGRSIPLNGASNSVGLLSIAAALGDAVAVAVEAHTTRERAACDCQIRGPRCASRRAPALYAKVNHI
jgi:hypothetical protein